MKDLNIPITLFVMQQIRMKFQLNEFTDGQCTCERNGNIYEVNSDASCLTFQQSTSVLPAVTQRSLRLTPLCLQFHRQGDLPCWLRNSYNTTPTTTPPGMKSLSRSFKLKDLRYLIKLLSVYMYMAPIFLSISLLRAYRTIGYLM
mgnify:CR=1 FL=1